MVNIKLKQLIIYVENMNKMVEFYKDQLGLEIGYPNTDDYSDQTWVAFNTGGATFALHSGKESSDVPQDAPKFNFEVANIIEKRQELIDKGIEMTEITNATPTKLICFGRDPENNGFFLEMTQH